VESFRDHYLSLCLFLLLVVLSVLLLFMASDYPGVYYNFS
jgi:ABC-type microcin C transport system permease subunit YejE